jgi:hypothetical protein
LERSRRKASEQHPGAELAIGGGRKETNDERHAVQGHLETYLALAQEGQGEGVPQYVEGEFRRYLESDILAHGFACARCGECGHDFLIAFSCKGRALRPLVQRTAHGANPPRI